MIKQSREKYTVSNVYKYSSVCRGLRHDNDFKKYRISIKHEDMKAQLIIFQKLLSAICVAFVVCKTNASYFRNVKPNWEKSLKRSTER